MIRYVYSFLIFVAMSSWSYASTVHKIGVLMEGPRLFSLHFDQTLQSALKAVAGQDYEALIVKAQEGDALNDQIQSLMNNADLEAILGVGSRINSLLIKQIKLGKEFPKPVVVLFTVPETAPPIESPRFYQTHVALTELMFRDLMAMELLLGETQVTIAVDGPTAPYEKSFMGMATSPAFASTLKSRVNWVSIPSFETDWYKAFPQGTESVYMLPFLKTSDEVMQKVYQTMAAKGFPVFSMLGDADVRLGALGGLNTSEGLSSIARSALLDVVELLHGRHVGTPRLVLPNTQLTLNLRVAEQLGMDLDWPVLAEAVRVDVPDGFLGESLDLQQTIDNTIRANLDLRAKERELEVTAQDEAETRALKKPQVHAALQAQTVDEGHAFAALGQYQSQAVGSIQLTQLLYSEDVMAGVESQRQAQMARLADRDALRQDLVHQGIKAFFQLLQLDAVVQIRRDDVALNRTNLQLAQLRYGLGSARSSEVDRWKAQLANSRAILLESLSQYRRAERHINTLMNTPLQSRWVPKKESVEVFLDQLGGSEEARLLATQGGYSRLQEDLLNQILQRAPEMQALNALVSAQYRELDASKKAFSRPQVQLKANVNQTLWKDKTGGLDLGSLLGEAGQNLGTFPDTSWNVALQAQLPILSGGARTARKEKAVSTLEKLQVERVALKQGLEARFLAALDSAAASQPEMALRIDGAEAAERTLHAVQDAYAQGVEGLLTLLDAQNAALNLRLAARQAEYAFLQDWADVQRARGQLERLHSH